ncbi:MAG: HAMP domain-containing histidine kinase [Deltaproteobacteria bacterium]|nr:HAMP domain-containing histidine kinase [Deltaproteobacteria bacterium]
MNEPTDPMVVPPLDAGQSAAVVAAVRKLAHDVNNALVSAVSTLDLLTIDRPDLEGTLAPLRQELVRPRALFERPMRGLPTRAMVRPWTLADWRGRIADDAKTVGVSVRLPADLPGPAGLDEGSWVQCLDNTVRNALDAHAAHARSGDPAPAGGRYVSVQPGSATGTRHCVVADNGPVPEGWRAAVLARKARPGKGHLGLGLAVVAAHLHKVGGRVQVQQTADGFAVRLSWPEPAP